jgi:hypothetical protein
MNIFTNHSTCVTRSSFRLLENLGKFIGMATGINPYGIMMGNPFGNIMGSIIGLGGGGGFTMGGGRLITDGGLIIGGGGGFGWLIAD